MRAVEKVAKHLVLEIEHDRFAFARDEDKIAAEAVLDGIYVICTSLDSATFEASRVVASYKALEGWRLFPMRSMAEFRLEPLDRMALGSTA